MKIIEFEGDGKGKRMTFGQLAAFVREAEEAGADPSTQIDASVSFGQ